MCDPEANYKIEYKIIIPSMMSILVHKSHLNHTKFMPKEELFYLSVLKVIGFLFCIFFLIDVKNFALSVPYGVNVAYCIALEFRSIG